MTELQVGQAVLVHGVVESIDGYYVHVKVGYDQKVKTWEDGLVVVGDYDLASLSASDVEDRLNEDEEDNWGEWTSTPRLIPGLGSVRLADQIGGGEGEGYYMAVILQIEDAVTTRYFRKEGSYDSYEGGDWDGGFEEVAPKPVERIVYEVKR